MSERITVLYDHLPQQTAELLHDWRYKGVRPTVRTVGPIMPTVAFNTIDLKLPETGPAKILEINGINSGLSGYPEEDGGKTIVDRVNRITDSIGVAVLRFTWHPDTREYKQINRIDHPLTAKALDIAGAAADEQRLVADWMLDKRSKSTLGNPRQRTNLKDLSDAALIIEMAEYYRPMWSNFDPKDALVSNPAELWKLEEDKTEFSNLAQTIGAAKYRPQSRTIDTQHAMNGLQHNDTFLLQANHFVLKRPRYTHGGQGVVIYSAGELRALLSISNRLGSWGKMIVQAYALGFTSNKRARNYQFPETSELGKQLLVEEYIPSKPIKRDDGDYDATMRIAVMSLANKNRVTVVPVGAYWKLPEFPIGNSYSQISRVEEGGTLPVDNTDFRRAFRDSADFMKRVLHRTRITSDKNYWPRASNGE